MGEKASWWQRDVSFPHWWPYWPLALLVGFGLSFVLASFVSPRLVFVGLAFIVAAAVGLWSPQGWARPTRNTRRALAWAVCAFVTASAALTAATYLVDPP